MQFYSLLSRGQQAAPLPDWSHMFIHAPDNRQNGRREVVPIVGTQFRLKTFSKEGREKTVPLVLPVVFRVKKRSEPLASDGFNLGKVVGPISEKSRLRGD